MLLSEKEIWQEIHENVRAAPGYGVTGIDAAAHAIAEKMREAEEEASGESLIRLESLLKEAKKDVVWDEEYKVSYDGFCRFWEIDCSSGVRHYAGELATDALADLDGQRVTVTVTKEEGDGQAQH